MMKTLRMLIYVRAIKLIAGCFFESIFDQLYYFLAIFIFATLMTMCATNTNKRFVFIASIPVVLVLSIATIHNSIDYVDNCLNYKIK